MCKNKIILVVHEGMFLKEIECPVIEYLDNSKIVLENKSEEELIIKVSNASRFLKQNKELRRAVKLIVSERGIIFFNQVFLRKEGKKW